MKESEDDHQTGETPDKNTFDSCEQVSPDIKGKKGHDLTLTAQNESAQKKAKRPFEYTGEQSPKEPSFNLRELDPNQMKEINELLREYIEVPTPHSLPRRKLIPSPDLRPEALQDENLTEQERQILLQQQIYF